MTQAKGKLGIDDASWAAEDGSTSASTDPGALPVTPQVRERLRVMFESHYDLVWRVLRRAGLPPSEADDGAQQVFIIAARRMGDIQPATERSFLCATALKVAARARKPHAREVLTEAPPEVAVQATAHEVLELKRRRELLDRLLGEMDEDLRVALVLSDIEGLSKREVAEALGIPEGTAASRLRRAREDLQSRLQRQGGAR